MTRTLRLVEVGWRADAMSKNVIGVVLGSGTSVGTGVDGLRVKKEGEFQVRNGL